MWTLRPISVRNLPGPELRPVVGGDRAGADVRALADVGIADVREVRHLRTLADVRVLDLHECPGLRARFENRSGAKVTERPDGRLGADDRVDRDGMRADDGACADLRLAAQNRERMDGRVGLELDVGLDPRRLRIDDRDAREHVRLVDAVAKRGGRLRELGARVHALGLGGIGGDVGGDTLAILNQMAHGVGQVQLALAVRRVDPVERGPDPLGVEDVDRRVDLVDRELLRRRVACLDDLPNRAVVRRG